ncbi:MAG: PDDEXK nuclease domain-containing protein [Verrucomicrobiales bacterium]
MNYDSLIGSIRRVHDTALDQATQTVNRSLVFRNWLVGAHLVEFEQRGEDRAAYGEKLLEKVASDLASSGLKGLGISMLRMTRRFYELYPQIRQSAIAELPEDRAFPIRQSPIAEWAEDSAATRDGQPAPLPPAAVLAFSWTHLIEFIRLDDPWKRAFYENETLKGTWSVRQLQRQIGSLLYERTGLSSDKKEVIDHARRQAFESPRQIADLIRDPYVLEFAGLAEKSSYLERDLETLLLDHLQAFLLELGTGFCFEARQKRVTVGKEHDYIDLVFYHRILRCHLLIDLKIRAFEHGDAGQMNFYLNFWKDRMMQPGDQPPVGLILCADKEQPRVDYATAGLDRQLFVSRYLASLPSVETLQDLIERDTATWLRVREEATGYLSPNR